MEQVLYYFTCYIQPNNFVSKDYAEGEDNEGKNTKGEIKRKGEDFLAKQFERNQLGESNTTEELKQIAVRKGENGYRYGTLGDSCDWMRADCADRLECKRLNAWDQRGVCKYQGKNK